MVSAVRRIPNVITFSRMALTPVFICLALRNDYIWAVIVFGAICLTDMADGAAARALGAGTRFGAYIDVAADLIYVMSSLIVFNIKGLAPIWITVIVAAKFIEFAITSSVLKTSGRSESPWKFDAPGRCFSALIFLSPGVFCMAALLPAGFGYVQYLLLIPACVLGAASFVSRIARCAVSVKSGTHIIRVQGEPGH